MTMSPLARPLFTVLAISAIGAAEVEFLDLRLGGGILSDNFKGASSTTVTDKTTSISTTTNSGEDGRDADSNFRGQLQLVWGNLGEAGGLIVGGGIAINNARFDNGAQEADVTTPVIDIMIGYGYAVTPEWHFELAPFAGVGRTYYSVRDNGSSTTSSEWDSYYEYGVKIGTYFTADSGWQVGVEIPYLVGRFNPEYDHNDNANTYTISDERRNQGFGLLVTVGMRF